MRTVLILTRREVASYFVSPIAYVAMVLFLLVAGILFAAPYIGAFQPGNPAAMTQTFGIVSFILLLAVPILTMRSLAEERRSGTLETLLTAPVTDTQVVLGKFLGCWAFYLVMVAPTLLYVVALKAFGNPDLGPVASGYLGLVLLGALYVAVGLFASSLTHNQVIAAVVAFVILLLLTLLGPIGGAVPTPWRTILRHLSTSAHYDDFGEGVVDLVHVIYFAVFTLYVLFLTVKVLESRRWR